jgi:molybdopterin biosynthesis enzyme MoaB
LPGIEEAVRSSGLAAGATDAGLSRGLAGISGQTLVVNLADSRSAVRDGMATVTMLAHQVIADITEF